MAERKAVTRPVNIKTLDVPPCILVETIAMMLPAAMGMAMVMEGPMVIRRDREGLFLGSGGPSISTGSPSMLFISRGAR